MVISVVVNFLSQVIFAFLLFLGEIKNELQQFDRGTLPSLYTIDLCN